jgi:hypothetical protein
MKLYTVISSAIIVTLIVVIGVVIYNTQFNSYEIVHLKQNEDEYTITQLKPTMLVPLKREYTSLQRRLPQPLYKYQRKDAACGCNSKDCNSCSRGWCRDGVKYYTSNHNQPTYEEQYQLNELYEKERWSKQHHKLFPMMNITSETVCNSMGYKWCENFGINGVGKCTLNDVCCDNTGRVCERTQ